MCVCLWMWELDYKESWAPKNWCFWTMVLEKTLESPLDCKEIQPVHPKGDQSWVFIGRTDAEAESPILWPPHVKSWLIGKDPDAGRVWGQEEKGITEDEMAGWHHRLNGHEFAQAPGAGDGQEAWRATVHGVSKSWTWPSNWTDLIHVYMRERERDGCFIRAAAVSKIHGEFQPPLAASAWEPLMLSQRQQYSSLTEGHAETKPCRPTPVTARQPERLKCSKQNSPSPRLKTLSPGSVIW